MTQFQSRFLATAIGVVLVLTLLATLPLAQEPKADKIGPPGAEAGRAFDAEASRRRLETNQFVRRFESFSNGIDLEKELRITAEQKSKLDEILSRVRTETTNSFGARGAAPLPSSAERSKAREFMYERAAKDIKAVLTKEQLARMDQIDLQEQLRVNGMAQGLATGALGKALQITAEQEAKLREAETKADEAFRLEMENLRELQLNSLVEAQRKVLGVLTPEQRAEFEKLIGTPLKPDERGLGYGVAGVPGRMRAEGGFGGRGGFGTSPGRGTGGEVTPRFGRGNTEKAPPTPPPADPKP